MKIAKLRVWFMTTRPRTLVASFAPIVIGNAFAIARQTFSVWILICTLLAGGFVQILTNFANDYFDIKKGSDNEERIGPKRGIHKNLISFREMKVAMGLCIAIIALSSIYLIMTGGPLILILMLASILLAILYTAGPFSLAYTGLADIFVLIFFGPIATITSYWLQAHSITGDVLLSSLPPGFLATAILAINNMRDIKQDAQAKKKTLVVRFGLNFGRYEYLLMVVGAFAVPCWLWFFYPQYNPMIMSSMVMLTSIPMVVNLFKTNSPSEIGKLLLSTSFLLMSYTLVFMFGIFYAYR